MFLSTALHICSFANIDCYCIKKGSFVLLSSLFYVVAVGSKEFLLYILCKNAKDFLLKKKDWKIRGEGGGVAELG
jgi:hypothetical protein